MDPIRLRWWFCGKCFHIEPRNQTKPPVCHKCRRKVVMEPIQIRGQDGAE